MLSREENWLNIWAIKHLSQTRVVPVQIDTRTGRIHVLKDIKALLAWLGYLAAVQLHSFYAFVCFAKLLGKGLKRTKWALPYHYYKIFVPQLATLVAVVPFLVQPEVFAALFNSSIGATDNENCARRERGLVYSQPESFSV